MNGKVKNGENGTHQATPQPPVNSEQRWLRYPEVAKKSGVSERSIRRAKDSGKIPKPIKLGGCVLFDWPEVAAALNALKET